MNTYAVWADQELYWSGEGYRQVMAWAKALLEKGYQRVEVERIAPCVEYRSLGPRRLVR